MQHSSSNKYILTCRESIYFDEFTHLVKKVKLNPLTKKQISIFLKQYCGLNYYEIEQYQFELFENPLLLNIGIEVINSNEGKVPKNRSVLFNKYVDYLAYKWERKKGLKRKYPLSYYETRLFLSKLSFNMFESPYISVIKLHEFINKEYSGKDLDSIFEQILNIGILKFRSEDEILFNHNTFREFFAANYIVNNIEETQNFNVLEPILNKKQWYEVFIFSSGLFKIWEHQNKFLDYILDSNLKLYIDSINGKNDTNDDLLSLDIQEYSKIYLETLVVSYEKIINKFFSQIKRNFYPYNAYDDFDENLEICILGQLTEDRKHLSFTFKLGKNQDKIRLISSHEFEEILRNLNRSQSYYVNLDLSGLIGDSARLVALKRIKSELSKILERNLLNENIQLICERVEELKSRIAPIRELRDLDKISDWVNGKIQEVYDRADGRLVGILYDGVELLELNFYIELILKSGINYQEHLLPEEDNKVSGVSWIWDLYTKGRLIERIKKFFYYYQLSFIYIVENNFNNLKDYLPDYYHLPYKYVVEIQFNDDSASKDYFSEPLMDFYYVATDSLDDFDPEINIVSNMSGWEEKRNRIEKSYIGKERFTRVYSVCNTGVSMVIQETQGKKNLPLLLNTYDLVKKNLEKIFGRL